MTKTNTNSYKFFTEINSVQNLLQVLFNQLKKNHHSYAELISNLEAIVDGAEIANLPKELEPITIFLNKPELIISNLSSEDKAYFNTVVKNKLYGFILELKNNMNADVPDPAVQTSFLR
ncbi:hypothetical protein J2N86_11640 [Legionella lytica]|jgi:division protein CdvB (Snf7/Vps24/ESCRT-III family)|uniref:Substrate of the Dot/Icm secretion system n=1 Tax=Legionella lytica TaxID=96232 RepID=A0ABY4Y6T3_9GAMM|nr:hypothetical protein [Legionella lytica]USQ13331.1 hypothetical protein J2N86_11640 [Legionella lytica]